VSGERLVDLWRRAVATVDGVVLESGLSDSEVECAEQAYGLSFPPDVRECLQVALPTAPDVGAEMRCQFPNWRDLSNPGIVLRLSQPWEGWVFDLEHRAERAWLDKWRKAPESLADQIAHARRLYAAAPKLVPIFGHRYIASSPEESGNPVFSVHQMDIIHYGVDLEDYLHVEFLGRKHAS